MATAFSNGKSPLLRWTYQSPACGGFAQSTAKLTTTASRTYELKELTARHEDESASRSRGHLWSDRCKPEWHRSCSKDCRTLALRFARKATNAKRHVAQRKPSPHLSAPRSPNLSSASPAQGPNPVKGVGIEHQSRVLVVFSKNRSNRQVWVA